MGENIAIDSAPPLVLLACGMDSLLPDNLQTLRTEIASACARCGRQPADITILAVTKTHPPEVVEAAVRIGLTEIGENRVQEAETKFAAIGHIARYHLIGHLQSNKVKKAVALFDVIQSVDSLSIANETNRRAGEIGKTVECLIEVNTSGEAQKYGIAPDRAIELVSQVIALPNIRLIGLMTVGPLTDDDDQVREAFRNCRRLFEQARELFGDGISVLSMGMSGDFGIAIEEGSTMIRIGTDLFGDRE